MSLAWLASGVLQTSPQDCVGKIMQPACEHRMIETIHPIDVVNRLRNIHLPRTPLLRHLHDLTLPSRELRAPANAMHSVSSTIKI
jgi:hypothetical protein